MRRLVLAIGLVPVAATMVVAASSGGASAEDVPVTTSAALAPDEQAALEADAQCRLVNLTECAEYDPAAYDPNWRTYEDAATGEDLPTSADLTDTPWTFSAFLATQWTCTGNAEEPSLESNSRGRYLIGYAEQICSGVGWEEQRVVTSLEWKHTRRFARDHWHEISRTMGALTFRNPERVASSKFCGGTKSRTFRTVGRGYADDDRYGGDRGGRENSGGVKLPCDITAH